MMETRERSFIGSTPPSRTQQHSVAATMTTSRKPKPKPASAYQYYQKLVQDFDSLEREMESQHEERSELEAQLERAKAKIRISKDEDQQVRQLQWERERDRQLEAFVLQRTTLNALRTQKEALDEQELHLQAEMEVLREKQQEASETEARRIRRLVHERTTLLEDELAKGKLDLDYIAQVVSTARCQELKRETQRELHKSSVGNLVQDVQERRRCEFDVAQANFQARLRSFQLEKEALAQKAQKLRVTKHRALQILSQNQQLAIKGFFDAPPSAQQSEGNVASPPSLDFGEILESLHQSGAQVEQIQIIDSERNSGRREFADALTEARATLERGPQRVEAIQKSLLDRKAEAQTLGIVVPGTISTAYDGAWGIESYSPRQYATVYFMRGLVFSWMDTAVADVTAQPTKELLELEVKRWEGTHASVEQDRDRERNVHFAKQILDDLMIEVFTEITEDIRLEFESSSYRVRNILKSAFKNALFPTSRENLVSPQGKKIPAKSQAPVSGSPSTLLPSLFELSLDHLRTARNRRNDPKSITPLHQCCLPIVRSTATMMVPAPITTKSPAKKTFDFFSTSRGAEATQVKKETSSQPQDSNGTAHNKPNEAEIIPFLSPDILASPSSAAKPAMKFWQDSPHLRLRTVVSPSVLGYCSCLQLSPNGDLLICGTTKGELILWDLLSDQPTILRMWSPPKAERSRVTRVIMSPDAQVVIAFFRRKTLSVFVINPNAAFRNAAPQMKEKQAAHSEDFFPVDSAKYKPRSLEMLIQISAPDALAELSFTSELRERVPSAVSKDPATGWTAAELSCGSFFTSFALTGMATCNASVLCGASTGDLIKLNLYPQRGSNGLRSHGIQAAFDFPGPEDTESLNTKTIRREIFRGHQRAVLFASCINRGSKESKSTEILSVDQDGIICLWEYSAANFTGFGWFMPGLRLRLELMCTNADLVASSLVVPTPSAPKCVPSRRLPPPSEKPSSDKLKGEILQVVLTPDDARLVCMVFYADPTKKEVSGTLRFLQIMTSPMRLDRVQLNMDFVGGNGAPRFSLTSDFLLLLANNFVRVYTLQTGKEAQEPIALSTAGKQQLDFNNIACTVSSSPSLYAWSGYKTSRRRGKSPSTITLVVSSDQHSRYLVHSFTTTIPQGNASSSAKKPITTTTSAES